MLYLGFNNKKKKKKKKKEKSGKDMDKIKARVSERKQKISSLEIKLQKC